MHSQFVCQQCGYETSKWMGKCPECGEWNSLVETVVSTRTRIMDNGKRITESKHVLLSDISSKSTKRISTMIYELDRVLGGGVVPGQVTLIAGEPGIGKSTLLLQAADKLGTTGNTALYVSGEESTSQIKIRADRLGIKSKNITLLESTDIDSVLNTIYSFKDRVLQAVIVDSIQTMATGDLSGMAGSVGQVRECAFRLVRFAKESGVPIFIVGHVTKEGTVAGPSVLMHIVDTVLWFEGDKNSQARLIRAVKNRFGPTDEVGIFEMNDHGLISIESPEKAFLTLNKKMVPGSVTAQVLQGTRPILVEVQSLVVSSKLPFPKRVTQGVDAKRVEMLLAILIRRAGIPLYDYDCFVNIAGGINLRGDPSVDLAICLSLASAFFDKALPGNFLIIGEVGLLGDIRMVTSQEKRIKEGRRLGYIEIVSSDQIKYLSEGIKKYLR